MELDEICLLATGLVKLRSLYASGTLQDGPSDASYQPAIPGTDLSQRELAMVNSFAATAFRSGFMPPTDKA